MRALLIFFSVDFVSVHLTQNLSYVCAEKFDSLLTALTFAHAFTAIKIAVLCILLQISLKDASNVHTPCHVVMLFITYQEI